MIVSPQDLPVGFTVGNLIGGGPSWSRASTGLLIADKHPAQ